MTFVGRLMFDTVQAQDTYNISFSNYLNVTQFVDFNEKPSASCLANISLSWNFNESLSSFLLESSECELFVRSTLGFADNSEIYSRVAVYAHGFSFVLLLCIVVTLKELRKAAEFPEYAKNVSIISLLLNCVWNHFIFLIQFFLVMKSGKLRNLLILPSILLFIYANVFLGQIFIHAWKSRNLEFIANHTNSEDVRVSLFKFNCKIYATVLLGLIFLFNVIRTPSVLLPFLCVLWVPQIVKNAYSSSSNAPSILYLVCMSMEHLYIPLYLSLIDSNFMELKPSYRFGSILILSIGMQLLYLILQRIFGTRKLLPPFLRRKVYTYERTIRDLEEPRDAEETISNNILLDCPICLVNLAHVPEGEGTVNTYMETPCGHKFHKGCLEQWMEHRRLCPVCRALLPPL
eukprot:TRINITY_DN12822_c0_g1_i19.p1 TRINITY_DN12822_c0_g1~~TRINITY_DN12822_c0_g1_i19.p1  ORF type:complete len:403 (+),score=94.44 TRINITY_DN12822_c0_g1_i19:516-1724(+)